MRHERSWCAAPPEPAKRARNIRARRLPGKQLGAASSRCTGWFNDIFDAKLVFDESSCTTIPDAFLTGEAGGSNTESSTIKCFDGKGALSGKLVVAAPEGRAVSHNGIDIIFKTTNYGPLGMSTVVVQKAWTLLEAGAISDAIEIGFDIDLPELNSVLRDTFNGEHMKLRHSLGFRIVRPW